VLGALKLSIISTSKSGKLFKKFKSATSILASGRNPFNFVKAFFNWRFTSQADIITLSYLDPVAVGIWHIRSSPARIT
jgi:hypothetical protein